MPEEDESVPPLLPEPPEPQLEPPPPRELRQPGPAELLVADVRVRLRVSPVQHTRPGALAQLEREVRRPRFGRPLLVAQVEPVKQEVAET